MNILNSKQLLKLQNSLYNQDIEHCKWYPNAGPYTKKGSGLPFRRMPRKRQNGTSLEKPAALRCMLSCSGGCL